MHKLDEFLHNQRPSLKKETIVRYRNSILRVQKKLGENFSLEMLDDWLSTLKPGAATRILSALLLNTLGDRVHSKYKRLFDKYNKEVTRVWSEQKFSEREKKHWTSVKRIRHMLRRMKEDVTTHKLLTRDLNSIEFNLLRAYVMFSIHHEFQVRNDMRYVRVLRTQSELKGGAKADSNYYVITSGVFIYYRFKTQRAFQRKGDWPVHLQCSKRLQKLLRAYVKNKPQSPFLFSDAKGDPLSGSTYSNIMTGASKRYIGVRLGPTALRKLYLSEFEKTW